MYRLRRKEMGAEGYGRADDPAAATRGLSRTDENSAPRYGVQTTPAESRMKLSHPQVNPDGTLPFLGEEEQGGGRATPGYMGWVSMTTAYLAPYDAPGQASAMKRAATGGGARFGKDDERGKKPRAMPPLAREGGNLMNPSAYGTGARGDLSPMSKAT